MSIFDKPVTPEAVNTAIRTIQLYCREFSSCKDCPFGINTPNGECMFINCDNISPLDWEEICDDEI